MYGVFLTCKRSFLLVSLDESSRGDAERVAKHLGTDAPALGVEDHPGGPYRYPWDDGTFTYPDL